MADGEVINGNDGWIENKTFSAGCKLVWYISKINSCIFHKQWFFPYQNHLFNNATRQTLRKHTVNPLGAMTRTSLQWRYNEPNDISNHQPHHCLLNSLFRRRSKKASELRSTGLCAGNSPVTGEFPAQMASNTENVSIWWRHHVLGELFKKQGR